MRLPENFSAYVFEGLIVGIAVSSMSASVGYVSKAITGEDDDNRVFWIANLVITMIAHIIAESFSRTRIVALLKLPGTPSLKDLGTTLRLNTSKFSTSDLPKFPKWTL